MKRQAHVITCLVALLLVDTFVISHGFLLPPRPVVAPYHCNLSTLQFQGSLWKQHALGVRNASAKRLALRASPSDDSVDDGSIKKTGVRQALQQEWKNFEIGASYVNDNYLSLLVHILSRVLSVVATVWLVIGLSFLLSPTIGRLVIKSILRALDFLSYADLLASLPFLPFFAVVGLALGLISRVAISSGLLKREALASFLEHLTNMALSENVKMTTTASIWSIIDEKRSLANELHAFLRAPISEELQYRLLFDRTRRFIAHATGGFRVKGGGFLLPNKFGSFIFACIHINNWLSRVAVDALAEQSVVEAVLVLSLAIAQATSAFFVSESILFPVYEKRGVMASIGAHSAWNILNWAKRVHVPVRLLLRCRNRLRRDKETD